MKALRGRPVIPDELPSLPTVTEHFKDFFTRPSPCASLLPQDVLAHFKPISSAVMVALDKQCTLSEFRKALQSMKSQSNPGALGLSPSALKCILEDDAVGNICLGHFNDWVAAPHNDVLLLALLTAIPKPGRDPMQPPNLRPISVASVWYRVAMKVFLARFSQ